MRTICYTSGEGLGYFEQEKPMLQRDDDVLIRIAYCGICGSDINIIKGYEDKFLGMKAGDRMILGHEASGTIEALGKGAVTKGLKVGDKVAIYFNEYCGKCHFCRNGQEQFCTDKIPRMGSMADYITRGEQQVFKLDDDTTLLNAALAEPISVVMRGMDLLNLKPGSTMAISGGGGIGLLFTQIARNYGASRITVLEPVAEKRETVLQNGADYVIDPFKEDAVKRSKEITDGRGFDIVVECSGVRSTIQTSYDILSRGGTLELFAAYPKGSEYSLNLASFFEKEAKIIGVFQSPYMYPRSLEMLKRINTEPLTNCTFKAEQWKEAFDYRMTGKPQKVIMDFTDKPEKE